MKFLALLGALATTLYFASPVQAQSCDFEIQSTCCNHGKDAKPWKGYQKGIKWEKSLDAAMQRAKKEGKPILLHQLVGDMNKVGC